MELLSETVYWHWIILGLLLIIVELFVPLFVILWLGVAAIIVGILLLTMGIGIEIQLVTWAVLSAVFILLWHRYVSPRLLDQTTAGLSREAIIGQIGLVIEYHHDRTAGLLRFPAPIVGNDEWEFTTHTDDSAQLQAGDKVKVIDITGNRLIIKPDV